MSCLPMRHARPTTRVFSFPVRMMPDRQQHFRSMLGSRMMQSRRANGNGANPEV